MALILPIGAYTARVQLLRPVPGKDARGQALDQFEPVGAPIWAAPEPLRGRELFAAAQHQAQIDVRFVIRWRADVLASWRVVWRGIAYDLVAPPIDTLGQRVQLELMTARVAGAGVPG